MNKRLLLISNSTNAGEPYLGWCGEMIKDFAEKHNVTDVLFVPYAGVSMGYDAYEQRVAAVFDTLGLKIHSLHRADNPVEAVKQAQCVAVGGGNTFHLVYELWRLGEMKLIRERAEEGMPYMGWSAGSNVACPSLKTTNDMPIIEPERFDCMNLVKFQINPHYTDFFDPKHGGETRQDRINEFLKVNQDINVVGLREATALSLEEGKLRLIGRNNPLVLFKYNQEPKHYGLDSDLNFLL
ncbi:MAG: dipeptidase PepE [Bacteroidales bacterium]|jgi:dipeptidase E|nr:dipeptidase PepE [Bacteroidales bacterium]